MIKDTPFAMDRDSEISDVSMSEDSSDDEVMEPGDSHIDNEDDSEDEEEDNAEDEAKGEEDEEEDELVKAITASKELHREHPPDITVDDYILNVCFHPEQDLIALANVNGDIFVHKYNNTETSLQSVIEVHEKACRDIQFNDNGDTLYSVSKDKSIMITDFNTQKLKGIYENAHDCPINVISLITENTFATGDDDGTIKLWDSRHSERTPIFSVKKMNDYVSSMLTNDEKKYLVCSSGDGSILTINLPAKKVQCQSFEYDEEFTCMGLFKNSTKILAASGTGKFYIFNWGEFGLHSDEFPNVNKKSINCMVPITDNIVITGNEDGLLRAFSVFPHARLGIAGQHDYSVETLDISRDGSLIASSSHDNKVKFWNIKYFETYDLMQQAQGNKNKKSKQAKFNLPSSKIDNSSDFFADLNK
ncbi:WD repeat-containing protein 55 homolog isoform X1 [Microplitis demolitor]|uniref:WD repeat-containing protein 55 homolog isoform X1 n=2 Tax=Microplitis demolitor TaxID=69319 RepID=UPI0004CD01AB|nr:WD repeat-containing protein 55 homolog isoform X1 [Microplitis demolitor]